MKQIYSVQNRTMVYGRDISIISIAVGSF